LGAAVISEKDSKISTKAITPPINHIPLTTISLTRKPLNAPRIVLPKAPRPRQFQPKAAKKYLPKAAS
jgi:hypothetical protein